MDNCIKIDDLEVPPFQEITMSSGQAAEGAPIRPSCRDGKDTPKAMLPEGDILGPGRKVGPRKKNHRNMVILPTLGISMG